MSWSPRHSHSSGGETTVQPFEPVRSLFEFEAPYSQRKEHGCKDRQDAEMG
jgi:hypothetical protein